MMVGCGAIATGAGLSNLIWEIGASELLCRCLYVQDVQVTTRAECHKQSLNANPLLSLQTTLTPTDALGPYQSASHWREER